jgi:hypothetical protein
MREFTVIARAHTVFSTLGFVNYASERAHRGEDVCVECVSSTMCRERSLVDHKPCGGRPSADITFVKGTSSFGNWNTLISLPGSVNAVLWVVACIGSQIEVLWFALSGITMTRANADETNKLLVIGMENYFL